MDSNRSPGRENDPEHIDLIDLAMQLWHGVATIIVFILAGILAAVGYLMLAEEQWTSTAIITRPDIGQVTSYYNVMATV
ncbi:Wzz/FepE/Etk N-terminal domain-containing protein, partial [Salmonella enterica]|nr:Wzz/FepE/Etk N-terminal domain-containing protein [Salmonella enterica]MDJ7338540.1 Wzz/FepE/Etk N-terminal domain-containing protein [Salmonella enterica]